MSRTLLLESIWELMEATPKTIDVKKLTRDVNEMEGVVKLHDVHVWSVSPDIILMMANCDVTEDADAKMIIQGIERIAMDMGIKHSKVQFSEASHSES